jgi:K+ transport systems, NAD-binding component
MKIIIVGDGKLGYTLAELLSKDNNVVIIDKNADILQKTVENLDVMCVHGNATSARILLEAGVKDADLLIAVTSGDEVNMVCCFTAKRLGAQHTIARIRDPEYAAELSRLKLDLGLDLIINPDQALAREIAKLLQFPPAAHIEMFAQGHVEMVEIKITPAMPIVGVALKDVRQTVNSSILIGAALRDQEAIIPNGEFVIQPNDRIYLIGRPSEIYDFCKQIGMKIPKITDVMVIGGGRSGYYLAKSLENSGMDVKIVEIDYDRCVYLSENLSKAMIIHGDGSDDALLQSENLNEMQAFIALTGRDEENLMSALMAKQAGVSKVVAKISRTRYVRVIEEMGVDNILNPKYIAATYISSFVRGLKNAIGNPVNMLYHILDNQAEAVEFIAGATARILNTPLKNLRICPGVLVAAIVRKNRIMIPHGEDTIQENDFVIIISKNMQLMDIDDILEQEIAGQEM